MIHMQVEIRVEAQQKRARLNIEQVEWIRTWVWGRIILGTDTEHQDTEYQDACWSLAMASWECVDIH